MWKEDYGNDVIGYWKKIVINIGNWSKFCWKQI